MSGLGSFDAGTVRRAVYRAGCGSAAADATQVPALRRCATGRVPGAGAEDRPRNPPLS